MVIRKHKKELTLEDAIKKGASVIADQKSKEWAYFSLRIRKDISDDIDQVLEKRIGISKTAWILEAMQEKLRRELNG